MIAVALRPTAASPVLSPLPGSPFKLLVVPGVAHPLSTMLYTTPVIAAGAFVLVLCTSERRVFWELAHVKLSRC